MNASRNRPGRLASLDNVFSRPRYPKRSAILREIGRVDGERARGSVVTEFSQETQSGENFRQWPRLVASRVFLVSAVLYCIWMLVDLIAYVFAIGPLGLVLMLSALPARGIMIIMAFAVAKPVREGRYLGAAIALAVYMFVASIAVAILTYNARELQTPGVIILVRYGLAVMLALVALAGVWCTIAAYRDVRSAPTTPSPEPTPDADADTEDTSVAARDIDIVEPSD